MPEFIRAEYLSIFNKKNIKVLLQECKTNVHEHSFFDFSDNCVAGQNSNMSIFPATHCKKYSMAFLS